jgi:uncharacterized membrane protein YphA (DoxX/SURF4 family)
MSLLRAAARTMLASYFVINGAKALKNPQSLVDDAQPVANAIVPVLKRVTPAELAARIPEDTATLVRVTGGLQAIGGLALATGIGRRFGALALASTLIPATLARHPFWTRTDPAEKASDRAAFVKNLALLGGVLIASADTEGKPSLAWRAEDNRKRVGRGASRAADTAGAKVRRGGKALRRQAKQAAKDAAHAAHTAQREAQLAAKDIQLKLS